MEKKYRIYTGHGISYNFNRLQKDTVLSIGIMDTGTVEGLADTIDWFHQNFNYSLFVVTYEERLENTSILSKYDDVVYIIFKKAPDLGMRINAIAAECTSSYFYTTRTDTLTFKKVLLLDSILDRFKKQQNLVVQTPLIFNKNEELVPTVRAPHINGKEIDSSISMPEKEEENNLTPFLGLGFYNRIIFQRIRGFDEEIKNAYWQAIDFGIRCHLYGYKILSVADATIAFPLRQSLMEDCTECKGIERLYTKALGVTMTRHGEPRVKKAYRTDKKVLLSEVKPRASLYKTDYKTLCALWEK